MKAGGWLERQTGGACHSGVNEVREFGLILAWGLWGPGASQSCQGAGGQKVAVPPSPTVSGSLLPLDHYICSLRGGRPPSPGWGALSCQHTPFSFCNRSGSVPAVLTQRPTNHKLGVLCKRRFRLNVRAIHCCGVGSLETATLCVFPTLETRARRGLLSGLLVEANKSIRNPLIR